MGFEVVLLAGGLGTRLRSVVSDLPKPMAPINNRPFLAWLLDYWLERGATRFVLSIGYRGGAIKKYFGAAHQGVPLVYVEETKPLGTGGAIKAVLERGAVEASRFFLLNGDTWLAALPDELWNAARQSACPVHMAVKAMPENARYGGVVLREGMVEEFAAAGRGVSTVNAGCYVFLHDELLRALADFPDAFSFERDLLPGLAARRRVSGSLCAGAFVDIGVPEDYARAQAILAAFTDAVPANAAL